MFVLLIFSLFSIFMSDAIVQQHASALSIATLCLALLCYAIFVPSWQVSQSVAQVYFVLGGGLYLFRLHLAPDVPNLIFFIFFVGISRFVIKRIIAFFYLCLMLMGLLAITVVNEQVLNISFALRAALATMVVFFMLDHLILFKNGSIEERRSLILKAFFLMIMQSTLQLFFDALLGFAGSVEINLGLPMLLVFVWWVVSLKRLDVVKINLLLTLLLALIVMMHLFAIQEFIYRTSLYSLALIVIMFSLLIERIAILLTVVMILILASISQNVQGQFGREYWLLYLSMNILMASMLYICKPILGRLEPNKDYQYVFIDMLFGQTGQQLLMFFFGVVLLLVASLGPTMSSPLIFGSLGIDHLENLVLWVLLAMLFATVIVKIWYDLSVDRQAIIEKLLISQALQSEKFDIRLQSEKDVQIKRDFLKGINNKLKEPVDNIKHILTPCLEPPYPISQLLSNLPELRQHADRLQRDVENILQISRIELSQLPRVNDVFNLCQMIDIVIAQHPKRIQFNRDEMQCRDFYGDGEYIKQILTTLINRVSLRNSDAYCKLVVASNKDGFNIELIDNETSIPAHLKSILLREEHAVWMEQMQFHDLEVVLCHDLIALLGGSLSIQSDFRGTHLRLNFPFVVAEGEDNALQSDAMKKYVVEHPDKPCILIIEDDPLSQQLITKVLNSFDVDIEMVSTGIEGLERVRAGGVDILISDIGLPDMDGVQLIKTLRAEKNELIAFALTGWQSPEHKAHFKSAGFDDVFNKPLNIALIRQVIGQCLKVQNGT